ncbi:hypothetical protein JTE90_019525 [Oedothorax gibbosus]|uniref:G-protein coupled receptors family 1 profile domain-containing protein n=1 Tax=Oedothorax gibbosus TaxID=931172 RepID=A0AAV6VFQ9_9ARAC|nr:hypothetical protein JTE90_019525 [Oedothorax gibbosus]
MDILLNDTLDWTNCSTQFLEETNNASNLSMGTSNFNDSSLYLSDSIYHQPIHQQPLANMVALAATLSFLTFVTIVGNVLVLAAIMMERHLQTISNYLVVSLAVADLAVACLVMPMGAQYEVIGRRWELGAVLCEVWTSSDVLCCTASILHLVAIAYDRYCAVTDIEYVARRSSKRVVSMIALIWGVALLVSIAPVLGWKDEDFLTRIQLEKRCLVSQDMGYQIFATCATFYVPLCVILFLYWRIYQVARSRIRRRPGHAIRPTTLLPLVVDGNVLDMKTFNGLLERKNPSPQQRKLESKREKKAGKTLVIITGVFAVCWLPFFVTALLMALCPVSCDPGPEAFSFFLWLGYANSTLNPLIYTVFSPDFRRAFAKVFRSARRAM